MNENILNFGHGGRLTGTLTLPLTSAPAKSTAILLLNAGVIHRMGPHRINVKLARHLAAQGFTVLRIDLSGQGDSQNAESPQSFEQQAVLDLQAAMDHLQRITSAKRFALAGICSGAHHGVAAALQDERLSALWLMDTHTYPTLRTYWVRSIRQLRQQPGPTLRRWGMKIVNRLTTKAENRQVPVPSIEETYGKPPKAEFAAEIQSLIAKQVRLQIVYSGGVFWSHNYPAQWRDAFKPYGAVARVPNELLPDVDHTASTLTAQHQLIESVSRFANQFD
ncbi:alpha/beta fold hydrolase [Aquabacterium sp.]|uniref:alpha/beta fold hydrolase n=1 Tax=Aquabacterium sp. TaxID=1872578 RepID=UPI003D6CA8DA